MSENEDISSTTSKSLLPEYVIAILNKGMKEGFKDSYLDLNSKNINDSMIPELCEWITKLGDKVKILDLDWNPIASLGASMLFDTLKMSSASVQVIYSGDNKKIDNKCMKSLGEYIKSNKSIEVILLNDTSISDAGIEILSLYLDGNTTFKQLKLDGNKGITDKSIPFLEKMIELSCIEDININRTPITQINTIYALLACNRVKNGSTSLDLSQKSV